MHTRDLKQDIIIIIHKACKNKILFKNQRGKAFLFYTDTTVVTTDIFLTSKFLVRVASPVRILPFILRAFCLRYFRVSFQSENLYKKRLFTRLAQPKCWSADYNVKCPLLLW